LPRSADRRLAKFLALAAQHYAKIALVNSARNPQGVATVTDDRAVRLALKVAALRAKLARCEQRAAAAERAWFEGFKAGAGRPAFPPDNPYYRTIGGAS
jgi:hypothetical protein